MKKLLIVVVFALLSQPNLPVWAQGMSWSYSEYDKFESIFGEEARNQNEGYLPIYEEDRTPDYYLMRFVLEGPHDSDDWIEALEIINTARSDEPGSLKKWYKVFHANADSKCPSEWTVIEQERKSMLFERLSESCGGFPAQQALYRVLYGKYDVHVLIATRKPSMDDATRDGWLRMLRSAKLDE